MAVLGKYRINQTDILSSQSGNAILAIYNKPNSLKKVYIKNVEIQNLRRDSLGTNTSVTDWQIRRITAQTSGKEITATKLDTNASNVPTQIKIYKGGAPTLATTTVTISTTTTLAFAVGPPGTITRSAGSWLTDGVIAGTIISIIGSSLNNTGTLTISSVGNLTFNGTTRTITRSSGSWITDGVMPGARLTVTGTANNNKTFRVLTRDSATQVTCVINDVLVTEGPVASTVTGQAFMPYYVVRSATATVITVETQSTLSTEAAVAATATAFMYVDLHRFCSRHNFFSTTTNAFLNHFNMGQKGAMLGSMFNTYMNKSNNIESIIVAPGEGISVMLNNTLDLDGANATKEFHTYLIEGTFSIDWGGGAKTYFFTDYMSPNGESSVLFSIMNNTGSGQNLTLLDLTISEIGDTSTPYFMIVPFDAIDPQASVDDYRDVPYMKIDTNGSNIDSFVDIKKDVAIYPKGFSTGGALFPMSFGSAVPANGLNYLVTKDFLGPIFSAFFAEKSEFITNPTTNVNNLMTTIAQKDDTMFKGNDFYLSEGEGFAIVASAEPLSGVGAGTANQVNKPSMGKFDYSVTFTVEDVTLTLELTGLVAGSEVRVLLAGTETELAGIETSGTTFTWDYVYSAGYYVDIIVHSLSYEYLRLPNVLLTSTGVSIPIQQRIDRNYVNP